MVRVYSLTRLLLQCTETYTSLKFQVIWAENGTTVLKGTPIYLYTAKKKKNTLYLNITTVCIQY